MNLAIIPARGGSKRIPRKNLRDFHGKPIIAWSIQAALASECFDEVIVSTDDSEIAEVAKKWGASVPFIRPAKIADDHTSTAPVISHAIQETQKRSVLVENVCCIYATAPFVRPADIRKGYELLSEQPCDYVFSVARFDSPIQRAFRVNGNGYVEMFYPEKFDVRSQDLEPAYFDAAQFYWGLADAWLQHKQMFNSDSIPLELPGNIVQDIDTEEDWVIAEQIFELRKSSEG